MECSFFISNPYSQFSNVPPHFRNKPIHLFLFIPKRQKAVTLMKRTSRSLFYFRNFTQNRLLPHSAVCAETSWHAAPSRCLATNITLNRRNSTLEAINMYSTEVK